LETKKREVAGMVVKVSCKREILLFLVGAGAGAGGAEGGRRPITTRQDELL
jgi:hypothetical protein